MTEIDSILKDAQSVAVSGHVRPDGDCVGSTLAVYNYIKDYYPDIKARLYLEPSPNIFKFMQRADEIDSSYADDTVYDLFIACDCSDTGRLGSAAKYFESAKRTLCIDHHVTNGAFADANYIFPDASSTCELVFELLPKERITIQIAECIYTGMVHDTGVFQYSCTSKKTMDIAGSLMEMGIDYSRIIDDTFYTKTFAQNKIMGQALLNAALYLNGDVILSAVSRAEMEKYDVLPKHLDGIVNQLRVTKDIKVAVFLYENEDGTYYYYAKAGDKVQLAFAGENGSHWSWNTAELPDGVIDAADDAPAHFIMPANAVTIEASANSSTVIPRAYRVQVQLPADVAFAEDAAPVTVSVPDTTGTDENPKPDRTSTTALGAEPEQLVTLKFDAATLPDGYTFGQWVVTQLLPEQTTVEVTAVSDLEATFTMPASPVTVTFTVNAPVEPEPDPEPSGDGGAGAVIAGALIGGTAYLLGTRAWLEGTYGYVPANRMELALGLWKRANCPAPVSTELYADIGQNDADAQAAARWCVEQGLLKDYHEQNDDGTETVTFKPGRYVARPYALTRWYQLEKLLDEQQAAQAETPAEAPAQTSET